MTPRAALRHAPCDASAISVLLVRAELATIDAERERLKAVVAQVAPRRSSIVEGRLKQLTRRRVELLAAIGRAAR